MTYLGLLEEQKTAKCIAETLQLGILRASLALRHALPKIDGPFVQEESCPRTTLVQVLLAPKLEPRPSPEAAELPLALRSPFQRGLDSAPAHFLLVR